VYNSALLLEEQIGQRTQELQRSRDLLRTIFDGIPGGLVLLDTNGTILAVNRAYADLLGQEPQPMVGRTYATIWPEALRSDSQDLLHRCIADATPLSQRTRLDRPDQSPVVLDRHLFPVHSNTGTDTVQVIEYLDDVTERLALERVIAQTEQLAALGKLAATVAHEVNTPLLAIRGCVSLAASSTDEATRTEYLGLAQVELERAASIIRDMLDFYRPAGSQQVSVDINGLVGQVLQLLRAECAHREIVVLPHLAPYLSNVVGAPDQLKQVLLNLVLNAIEAMSPAGGTLTVTTSIREPEPGVIVTISDTGPGIPASILNRIFDAFVTTKSDGNGLGLAVCRTILADHDGLLTAANLPAGGACFTMVLTRTTDSPR
jgi:two-component system sensor histidine kinase AtoS